MWVEIFAFYFAHFDDFLTTGTALSRVGNAYEGNFFIKKIASSTFRLLVYKLSLATLVVSRTFTWVPLHFSHTSS
ncbi:hypothetical protein [Sulfuracidifex tepidarius]|uniref:Uncharacterized protein n=1 Tax=Sulfuracidifex tepidarius TaxID=1294262 RepID=A0A510DU31_9CREN|nr:hypothetical protein [Sulfuracidifex tepidarius]BBG23733.1 hypothetical protein IC006_1024 [Sulfuracidifex tepidarius]BBG26487.1 hypothetical protein IC007_0998 [Sulfuracidifex tepidarius]